MKDNDAPPPADRPPGEPKQSGRVAYDAKGNPIWEWETSTGVFDRDVSTQRLKKLEAKLSLEEPEQAAKPNALGLQEPDRLPGGGMNPYDTSGVSTTDEPAKHPALAHKHAKQKPISNSLASKYAHVAKKKAALEQSKPLSFWQKLLRRFSGK